MGQVKQAMIEAYEKGYSTFYCPNKKYLCISHFEDIYLKKYIEEHSKLGVCSYCNKSKMVIELREFIEYVGKKITDRFGNPDQEGLPLEGDAFDDGEDDLPGIQRVGCYIAPSSVDYYESTAELLSDISLISDNEELNEDILGCFTGDWWIEHSPFVLSKIRELSFMWKRFATMVKHEQRFTFFQNPDFSQGQLTEDNGLTDILTELGIIITQQKLCKKIGVDIELYRCRFIDTGEIVDTFDKITSPPDNIAKQSRMSPAGVSMFYGAFDKDTAIFESSPGGDGIGNYVVGKFKTKKELNVLDFTSLPPDSFWIPSDGEGVSFLHAFYNEIVKPIKRDDQIHIEYVPSQVFTEYLRYIYKLPDGGKVDGLIYKSSLKGADTNIVLFYNQDSSNEILDLIDIT